MEKNKVRVNIAGVTYSLITDETAEYTAELAAEIDAKMKEMQGANPFMSTNQAAVLIAIEFADKAKKAEQAADGYREQIKDYLKDASEAQTERDVELYPVQAASFRRRRELFAAEIVGIFARIKIARAEIHRVRTCVQRRSQCVETAARRQNLGLSFHLAQTD